MTSPSTTRRLVWTFLGLVMAALVSPRLRADDLLRLTYQVPGDSKPIVLHADELTTWMEGGVRVVLLKGRVLVEHGVVHCRMQQGVAWVDQERFRRTGVMAVDVYAEGEVRLENGPETRDGARALVSMSTRGEIRLKSQDGKVVQQARPEDPLYQRARATRTPQAAAPAPAPIQRTSAQQPAPPTNVPLPPGPAQPLPPTAPPAPAAVPPVPPGVAPAPGLPAPTPPFPVPPAPQPGVPYPGPAGSPDPVPPPPTVTPPLALPQPQPPAAPGSVPPPGTPPAAPSPPPGPAPASGPRSLLDGPLRQFSIVPRSGADFDIKDIPMPNGEHAIVVAGGVILNVKTPDGKGIIDIEADRLVFWTRENPQAILGNLRRPEGETSRQLEFYLSGNVEIRERQGKDSHTLRADEVYYDVGRNVAVAMHADLEYTQPGIKDPVHLKAEEMIQRAPGHYEILHAETFSSRLPSDPGLKFYVTRGTLDTREIPRRTLFGRQLVDATTGKPRTEEQRIFRGTNVFLELEDVPVFYVPYIQADANDPLGPLENIAFGQDQIFGTQFYTTWNVYDLLGIDPLPGTRWSLLADYLSDRGPALGTNYDYAGEDLFGVTNRYEGLFKAYGLYDKGVDNLGGNRGQFDNHPEWRGRVLSRQNIAELPAGFTVQTQVSLLSDKNFLEQFYKREFDTDINQETFLYVKQQQENWAWTAIAKPRLRNWVTETEYLPRVDGYLLGQSFFDAFTYNAWGNAAYARLRITDLPPFPVFEPTDIDSNSGRFDLIQELTIPFSLGALRLVPYGMLDLTSYTSDLSGDEVGRVLGGGGVRGSIPFSRLYPEIQSELFNLNGIHHKIVLAGNYYNVVSNEPYSRFAQFDRLNDDATDQALRDILPREPAYLGKTVGQALQVSPIFNPQEYAIRRLVLSRVDTRDTMQVFQTDLRQRWQTKRGYPGQQHIIDWMLFDVSASLFPAANRDNFGESWAFLEYDWAWHIGDRTSLVSTGWFDPFDPGARVWTIGSYINRPDRTNFFLGYRHIDPVDSRAVTASVTYIFSPKYAVSGGTSYDFGTRQDQSTQLTITRMGKDLQVSLGVSYNSMQDNFGVRLEIMPHLLASTGRGLGSFPLFGGGLAQGGR